MPPPKLSHGSSSSSSGSSSSKIPIKSNVMSFLMGVSFAYFFMKPTALICPPSTNMMTTTIPESSLLQEEERQQQQQQQEQRQEQSAAAAAAEGTTITTTAKEKNFFDIGNMHQTDKVAALGRLGGCLANDASCTRPGCVREECRPWGHFYQTMYQQRIGKYSLDDMEPFQFLEIGFFNGKGYDTYRDFLSPKAELHSMEISCIEEGPREEGKWPWGNFAKVNPNYQTYLKENRLHCGDASDQVFLEKIWKENMHRPDAPPLKIVVDDGSHLSKHMAQSVFFWFPRIEPGGLLIVEDIQPIDDANKFRTQFLPQIMSDLHFCGDPKEHKDAPCFPLLQSLLQSIHCEMHICIFERNSKPAIPDLPLVNSTMPEHTLNATGCPSIAEGWGRGLDTVG